ncbi:integumentary mucin A.1 isoform X2 [Drosophila takahashii]|uniref:integumentary mucin A.1 isoform X2 n=1 Tax=Drosophila takahashii TaxID=29030 RepID=UPI0038990897
MWCLKALVSLLLVQYLAATCDVCQSASKVACHSETTFSICYDGVPSYDLLPCPKDYYCTDGFYTCYLNADPVCKSETTTTEIPTTSTTEIPSTTTTEIPTTTTTTEIPTTTTTTEIPTTTTTSEIPTTTTTTEIPTTTTEAPWNPDDLCQQATKNTFFENVDDPTCTTFITCSVVDGIRSTKVTSCKANQYYSTSLKVCTATKPDGCVDTTTTETPSTTVTTTTAATTTTTVTTTTTTTAAPWSAEATCLTVSKTTLFKNEDDPTCNSYLYCHVSNGSATALIKSCKANDYFDATEKVCSATKPDYCT